MEEISGLQIENEGHKEALEKIVERDKALLEDYGFFDKRRNCAGFIGASILASNSHLLGTSETEFRNIGK